MTGDEVPPFVEVDPSRVPSARAAIAVGFTGTRHGMTRAQKHSLVQVLGMLWPINSVNHGCCVGADAEFHALVRAADPKRRLAIHGWPGRSSVDSQGEPNFRAAGLECDVLHPEMTHFKRNRMIVELSEFVIGCPLEMEEQDRGGTWYTIRHCRRMGRDHILVLPDGTLRAPPDERLPGVRERLRAENIFPRAPEDAH